MTRAILTINSRNYGAWSLRGWLLCRISGLEFEERVVAANDPGARAELLLLSPSFLVPALEHDGVVVWDTLAIGEYLHETFPSSGLLPVDRAQRARCRSVCAEMHAGFQNLRSSLPMNMKARYPDSNSPPMISAPMATAPSAAPPQASAQPPDTRPAAPVLPPVPPGRASGHSAQNVSKPGQPSAKKAQT